MRIANMPIRGVELMSSCLLILGQTDNLTKLKVID